LIKEIVELATGGLRPHLTLLFDLSVAESAVRTRRRVAKKTSDRLDSEDAEFHTRVRNAYVEMARPNPRGFASLMREAQSSKRTKLS